MPSWKKNQRREDRKEFWAGLDWRSASVGCGYMVFRTWVCFVEDGWYVLVAGVFAAEGEFMREKVRGPYQTEEEARAIADIWSGLERGDYAPLWAVKALDMYVSPLIGVIE